MPNHQAPGQMLGYLYQVRYALVLLLANDDENQQISIEKFDDVAFSNDDTPAKMIQIKHRLRKGGDLSDTSTDLWRTIKSWIDAVNGNPQLVQTTRFLIITTATAPEGSAASKMKSDERDIAGIYNQLKEICIAAGNKEHEKFYQSYMACNEITVKSILKKITVIDDADRIDNVGKSILRYIRLSCLPKYERQVLESVEGWWFGKVIECLCSDVPIYISYNQVRSKVVSLSREYSSESLPIDALEVPPTLSKEDLPECERVFLEQLDLICCGNQRMQLALRDYYRAFQQRGNWVRDELLYVNELEEYEYRLIDEWEHAYADMKDSLYEYGDSADERVLQRYGRELFQCVQNKDIRIRPLCGDAFVMRGSYHILANKLKVGWHRDFVDRLKHLLT